MVEGCWIVLFRLIDEISSSESTLTSVSEDEGFDCKKLPFNGKFDNKRIRSSSEEDMIRTELRRVNSHNDKRRDYVSVSRLASVSSSHDSSPGTDFTEDGEESTDLRFTTKPKSMTLAAGNVAKFTCGVSGTQPIDVYWFKEGGDDTDALETNDKYEVSSDGGKHTLEIFMVTQEDSGQYLCLAKNDITSSHWLFGLLVEESNDEQRAPLFLKELYDLEATEGDTVKMRCKVRAYPPPRVLWYKDGKRIDNCDEYKLEKFGNRDYLLTIAAVTLADDAEILVVARNGAGEAKSSAQLLIEPLDSHGEGRQSVKWENAKNVSANHQTRRRKNHCSVDKHAEESLHLDINQNDKRSSRGSVSSPPQYGIMSSLQNGVSPRRNGFQSPPTDSLSPRSQSSVSIVSLRDSLSPRREFGSLDTLNEIDTQFDFLRKSPVQKVTSPRESEVSGSTKAKKSAIMEESVKPSVNSSKIAFKEGSPKAVSRDAVPDSLNPDRTASGGVADIVVINHGTPHKGLSSNLSDASAAPTGAMFNQSSLETPLAKRSLRDAMGKGGGAVEPETTSVHIQPTRVADVNRQPSPKKSSNATTAKPKQPVQEDVPVQLLRITPINNDFALRHNLLEPESRTKETKSENDVPLVNIKVSAVPELDSVIPALRPVAVGSAQGVKELKVQPELPGPTSLKSTSLPIETRIQASQAAGVDIQPSFIREQQFTDVGEDASKIKPAVTQKHQKVSEFTPSQTIEIHSDALEEGIPNGRSEWSSFFPSVSERLRSYDSDSSKETGSKPPTKQLGDPSSPYPLVGKTTPVSPSNTLPNSTTVSPNNTIHGKTISSLPSNPFPSKATFATISNDVPSKAPPVSSSGTLPSKANPTTTLNTLPVQQAANSVTKAAAPNGAESKGKIVKKVTERTVVKRTISSPQSFGDSPPNDGHEYIKICGKWVRMKAKANNSSVSSAVDAKTSSVNNPMQSNDNGQSKDTLHIIGVTREDNIPASRSEWGLELAVGQQMTQFKKANEESGAIIAGRSMGAELLKGGPRAVNGRLRMTENQKDQTKSTSIEWQKREDNPHAKHRFHDLPPDVFND